jgi:hypothetical protein
MADNHDALNNPVSHLSEIGTDVSRGDSPYSSNGPSSDYRSSEGTALTMHTIEGNTMSHYGGNGHMTTMAPLNLQQPMEQDLHSVGAHLVVPEDQYPATLDDADLGLLHTRSTSYHSSKGEVVNNVPALRVNNVENQMVTPPRATTLSRGLLDHQRQTATSSHTVPPHLRGYDMNDGLAPYTSGGGFTSDNMLHGMSGFNNFVPPYPNERFQLQVDDTMGPPNNLRQTNDQFMAQMDASKRKAAAQANLNNERHGQDILHYQTSRGSMLPSHTPDTPSRASRYQLRDEASGNWQNSGEVLTNEGGNIANVPPDANHTGQSSVSMNSSDRQPTFHSINEPSRVGSNQDFTVMTTQVPGTYSGQLDSRVGSQSSGNLHSDQGPTQFCDPNRNTLFPGDVTQVNHHGDRVYSSVGQSSRANFSGQSRPFGPGANVDYTVLESDNMKFGLDRLAEESSKPDSVGTKFGSVAENNGPDDPYIDDDWESDDEPDRKRKRTGSELNPSGGAKNKNGQPRKARAPRSSLRRWDERELIRSLLGIVWACGEAGIQVPFAQAAQQVHPTCTASALQQTILKLHDKLNAEGEQFPRIRMNWPRKGASGTIRDHSKVPRRKPTLRQLNQSWIITLKRAYIEADRAMLLYPYGVATHDSADTVANDDTDLPVVLDSAPQTNPYTVAPSMSYNPSPQDNSYMYASSDPYGSTSQNNPGPMPVTAYDPSGRVNPYPTPTTTYDSSGRMHLYPRPSTTSGPSAQGNAYMTASSTAHSQTPQNNLYMATPSTAYGASAQSMSNMATSSMDHDLTPQNDLFMDTPSTDVAASFMASGSNPQNNSYTTTPSASLGFSARGHPYMTTPSVAYRSSLHGNAYGQANQGPSIDSSQQGLFPSGLPRSTRQMNSSMADDYFQSTPAFDGRNLRGRHSQNSGRTNIGNMDIREDDEYQSLFEFDTKPAQQGSGNLWDYHPYN